MTFVHLPFALDAPGGTVAAVVARWEGAGWRVAAAEVVQGCEVWTVVFDEDSRAAAPALVVCDADGQRLQAGDLVQSKLHWLKGDGYLPKKGKMEVRNICAVVWVPWRARFEAWQVGIHQDDMADASARWYRSGFHWGGFDGSSMGRLRPNLADRNFRLWSADAPYCIDSDCCTSVNYGLLATGGSPALEYQS